MESQRNRLAQHAQDVDSSFGNSNNNKSIDVNMLHNLFITYKSGTNSKRSQSTIDYTSDLKRDKSDMRKSSPRWPQMSFLASSQLGSLKTMTKMEESKGGDEQVAPIGGWGKFGNEVELECSDQE